VLAYAEVDQSLSYPQGHYSSGILTGASTRHSRRRKIESFKEKCAQRARCHLRGDPPWPSSLKVNGATRSVDAEPDTPLLYVLRNDLELNGAKYGCGLTQCGACTVLVNGAARRSCVTPVGSIEGNEVTTLEGLGTLDKPHPLQKAFIDEAGGSVRLLRERHDHGGGRPAQPQSATPGGGRAGSARRQSLPLRHPQPDHPRRPGAPRDRTGGSDDGRSPPDAAANSPPPSVASSSHSASFQQVVFGQDRRGSPAACRPTARLDAWLRINADGSGHRIHRQGRARARAS